MKELGKVGSQKPNLTVEGQKAFWDAQSGTYEKEEMTTDNQGEVDAALEACQEINCNDIVTLGGAVGCRDPKFILEDLFSDPDIDKPEVFFNDLSSHQTERARTSILKPFTDDGVQMTFLPGEIYDVCKQIPNRPRRLILGVYNCRSFFKAKPDEGYPFCGYDEYLRNSRILGETFIFDWVQLSETNELVLAATNLRMSICADDDTPTRNRVRDSLARKQKQVSRGDLPSISALQIVGQHRGRDGFFLSHWYTPDGILTLVRGVFPASDFTIKLKHFAKGMVLIVDPVNATPEGVVTVLNNVIGNVLPQNQHRTLKAIRGIIS